MTVGQMNEEIHRRFRACLAERRNEPGLVASFARDFLADPATEGLRTLSSIDRYLRENWGWKGAVDARDAAWRKFKQEAMSRAFEEDVDGWSL